MLGQESRIQMKILLFGTGDYYNRYRKWFAQQEVVALLDNSEQKQYTVIDGLKVLPPAEGIKQDYDIVVILSFYVKQMKQQLISLGVEKGRIYHFYDMHSLFGQSAVKRPLQYFLNAEDVIVSRVTSVSRILLLSHDLTLGGPAIALFHAAVILKKQGYIPVYASMMDGPLKSFLLENDIPVIVDENLQIATMQETQWVNTFSLIICNTLNFHVFLSERDTELPVIWWLHDARFFYDGVNKNIIGKIKLDNLKAVSVGPVPAEAVKEFLSDMECQELLYGVADAGGDGRKNIGQGITRFITIGFLEDIKGQDVLLQAVKRLPDDIRQQCSFLVVGHNQTLFGERIRTECARIREVVLTGSVERRKIHQLLEESNVLICPSRQDSMPTVAAEAMMHSVPCIVSDATGTVAYIHDGRDGFVFPTEDAQALAEKIEWCVSNTRKLDSMGKEARKLYEKHFSMPAFEKRFMEIINELLKKRNSK